MACKLTVGAAVTFLWAIASPVNGGAQDSFLNASCTMYYFGIDPDQDGNWHHQELPYARSQISIDASGTFTYQEIDNSNRPVGRPLTGYPAPLPDDTSAIMTEMSQITRIPPKWREAFAYAALDLSNRVMVRRHPSHRDSEVIPYTKLLVWVHEADTQADLPANSIAGVSLWGPGRQNTDIGYSFLFAPDCQR